ncbi:DUF2163 domain-containing protein [Methylobrevis pamukkalensis]|uniref:Bacteriophage phiJL001 Gp84 C-terminal domain-containing protein n=1 Tax=Methylobrevis pamukkalensis TaxID=1439726 RepID=A0A1E3H7W4_9HYPH|nr:DUF2163 domain-containing protein [Methylobrevis pamukkalensis]ODN72439.1 hypothetical protein A6302_00185 [Methylobrevis pamukkalensis]
MRAIPPALASHLAQGATTLATLWRLTRRDGTRLGFTDHDRDIVIGEETFAAATGFDRSAASASSDFAPGDEDVAGVIDAAALSEEDLLAGRWDGARVDVLLADWTAPENHLPLRTATIGEVTRRDGAFRAELRGPAHALDRIGGRLFGRGCDARFGDARCGIDAASDLYTGDGVVTATAGRAVLSVSALDTYPDGWFTSGELRFLGGPLTGLVAGIDRHETTDGDARVTLWRGLPLAVADGTAVSLVAGCDKRFATCAGRFANAINFRGFPHMPGNDFAFAYARSGGDNDGGVLFE